MLVKDWMSRPVITVEADASIVDVTNLLKEHHSKDRVWHCWGEKGGESLFLFLTEEQLSGVN